MSSGSAPRLASSAGRLGTESAFAVLARARELERAGRDVLHLEIGEPDFPTPPHVAEAGIAAIRAGETGYGPTAGLPELREAIADVMSRAHGLEIAPERVLVANGAKPLLFFAILALCEPGDEVLVPDPGFPIYASAIRWTGARLVPLPLRKERDFSIDPDDLEQRLGERTKLVILNSPHNPTGGIVGADDLARVASRIRRSSAWVLSDEVYARIAYEPVPSIASAPGLLERSIVLDSFSKTHAMTGWRCGYAAVPEPLVEPLTRFLVNSTSCVPPFVQRAGIAALTGSDDHVHAMVEELRVRRDLVVAGLEAMDGVTCRMPRGAFYAFPNVAGVGVSSHELAGRLLEDAGVALLDGGTFGDAGRGHLRISYAAPQATLRDALERTDALLRRVRHGGRQAG